MAVFGGEVKDLFSESYLITNKTAILFPSSKIDTFVGLIFLTNSTFEQYNNQGVSAPVRCLPKR